MATGKKKEEGGDAGGMVGGNEGDEQEEGDEVAVMRWGEGRGYLMR